MEVDTNAPLLDTAEAARRLSVSRSWLEKLRFFGRDDGPAYIKVGRVVRYRACDLDAWAVSHLKGGVE